MRRSILLSLIFISLVTISQTWAGDACSNASGRFLQDDLAEGRHHTRNWANSWGSLWALATVGQAVAAVKYQDPELRKDLWVGSVSSALGLIPTWIVPPKIIADGAEDDPCPTLAHEQMLLQRDAENDDANTGILAHAANFGVNLGIAAVLGAGFGHWSAAGISLGIGVAMGEMMILTYPRSASRLQNHPDSPGLAVVPFPGGAMLATSLPF